MRTLPLNWAKWNFFPTPSMREYWWTERLGFVEWHLRIFPKAKIFSCCYHEIRKCFRSPSTSGISARTMMQAARKSKLPWTCIVAACALPSLTTAASCSAHQVHCALLNSWSNSINRLYNRTGLSLARVGMTSGQMFCIIGQYKLPLQVSSVRSDIDYL